MTVRNSVQYYLDAIESFHRDLYIGTGHRLAQDEYEYNKNHVNYSAQHRIDIVKTLDSRSIIGLIEQLRILRYALDSMESFMFGGVVD